MRKSRPSVHIFLAAASLVLAILLGTVSMIAVYCLPTNRMNDNVGRSQDMLQLEQSRYAWAPGYAGTGLDGYTDAIMLGNAVFRGTGDPVQDAMRNPRIAYSSCDNSPVESVIRYVNRSEIDPGKQVEYTRYWHGYLVLLKPLLLFFTLSHIRMFNFIFQFVLLLAVLLELFRLGGYRLVVPFAAAVLWINPISTALCMQYSSIYYLMLVGVLLLVRFRLWEKRFGWLLFLWLGIGTAFFDFLTYPVAALGILLVLSVVLSEESLLQKLKKTVAASAAWCFGYAGMWCGKWVVASLITGENIIVDGLQQIVYRSGSQLDNFADETIGSAWEVILKNLSVYGTTSSCLLAILLLAVVVLILFCKYRPRFSSDICIPLLFIALYPFVWYAVVKNHSMVHYWMTHRSLSVTILAVGYMISCSLQKISGGKQYG